MAVSMAAPDLGVVDACDALGVSRATWYRHQQPAEPPSARPTPPNALSDAEREQVLSTLHSERFVDGATREVYATLLDEGKYLCAIRTMDRILAAAKENHERRAQRRHQRHARPELVAKAPNQVWSWDITKLRGPAKGEWYYLYEILDIYSRYAVGWLIATRENATLAEELIAETCRKEGIPQQQLTLHADRGSPMKSKTVAQLLDKLGVEKTHSRPRVSNDNPYSESGFKTMKYHFQFPDRFGSLEDARAFCHDFFTWYNHEHHHTGIALHTPATVHAHEVERVNATRQAALDAAYQAHPERFPQRPPRTQQLPDAVWINPPERREVKVEMTP